MARAVLTTIGSSRMLISWFIRYEAKGTLGIDVSV
jgi:hypothetical protein